MLVWFCELALENDSDSLINRLSPQQLTRYRHFCRSVRASQYLDSR